MSYAFNPFTNKLDNKGQVVDTSSFVPKTTKVNGHALSSDVNLQLNSSDFANEGTTTTVLHGNAAGSPSFGKVVENDISLSNNNTNDVSTSKHGLTPVLPGNSSLFLNGNGTYSSPTVGQTASFSVTAFTSQTSVTVTHNFGAYPLVQVLDDANNVLIPLTVVHNSVNDFTITFATSTSGAILASLGSPQPAGVVITSSNYSITNNNKIIKATQSGITITLPTAVGIMGLVFYIDNASTSNITAATTSYQTINDLLTQTIPSQSTLGVYSDGTNWRIL